MRADPAQALLALGLGAIPAIIGLIAWQAPRNTWDSMTALWQDEGSVFVQPRLKAPEGGPGRNHDSHVRDLPCLDVDLGPDSPRCRHGVRHRPGSSR